jgi:predicted metal-dependent enzyme (double-stranded beta helix superfamily)
MLAHRLDGQVSTVHDHGTWVAIAPVTGIETHRRYHRGAVPADLPRLAQTAVLEPAGVVTMLPPDDIHDHGHVVGAGAPAYVLILTGDDQRRYLRNEWDLATGRHRLLLAGDLGRWTADEPWPSLPR